MPYTMVKDIPLIISSPEYVGISPKDGSIEFVRLNQLNGDYVKVAVRSSEWYFIHPLHLHTKLNESNQFHKIRTAEEGL